MLKKIKDYFEEIREKYFTEILMVEIAFLVISWYVILNLLDVLLFIMFGH